MFGFIDCGFFLWLAIVLIVGVIVFVISKIVDFIYIWRELWSDLPENYHCLSNRVANLEDEVTKLKKKKRSK